MFYFLKNALKNYEIQERMKKKTLAELLYYV